MVLYIDDISKIIYIVPPKCGSTTINNMLKNNVYNDIYSSPIDKLHNPKYKKIIIIRKCVINRFLSGFYEDLFNNYCYNNLSITFNEYLLFLYKCFTEKAANVNNMKLYNDMDIPIWWGNCSNCTLPITNNDGNFCSHIQSQKFAIHHFITIMHCKNVKLIKLKDLSSIILSEKKNIKPKTIKLPDNFDLSTCSLSYIKHNRIIISKNLLTPEQQELILKMYKEDIDFMNELEKKYELII
jgi:hypothetical protein